MVAVVLACMAATAHAGTIAGSVYEAGSGQPVRGVALTLVYDDGDVEAGTPVPADRLGAGQQGQVVGADGVYRFDAPASRRYRVVVDATGTPYAAPSVRVPPRPGVAPLGAVGGPTPGSADRSYYLRFELPVADSVVEGNHIAVDALPGVVDLTHHADTAEAGTGDVVTFTVVVANRSPRDVAAGYVSVVPPRGLEYVRRRASATVKAAGEVRALRAGADFGERYEVPSSRRILRFGPFALPAGGVLTLRYRVAVGLDVRPGSHFARAVLIGEAGEELSARGLAELEVAAADGFETGVILGRVFCDHDGDRRFGAGDRGFFGARVYLDSGTHARTDSAGLLHFSLVRPGTHLVKLDAGTLAGGQLIGPPTRLLRITPGLPQRVAFPVRCAQVSVDGRDARFVVERAGKAPAATPDAAPATTVWLRGDTEALALWIDSGAGERPVALPVASLTLRGARNRPAVPSGGWGGAPAVWNASFNAPTGVSAVRWQMRIAPASAGAAPIRTIRGRGAVPAQVSWDGLDDDGQPAPAGLYSAQLLVFGDGRGAEAASARTVLGIAYGAGATGTRSESWTGALFAGAADAPQPTAALEQKIAALASALGDAGSAVVQVHHDGTGEPLETIARTQREADLIVEALVARGIDRARLTGHGRGSLEPVRAGDDAAARAANRRVVVEITTPPGRAQEEIPAALTGEPEVYIDGQPVRVGADGVFRFPREGGSGPIVVDLERRDGARAALAVELSPPASPSGPAGRAHSLAVRGDLAARTVAVAGAPVPVPMLSTDIVLVGSADVGVPDIRTRRGVPLGPLVFELHGPELDAVRWKVVIAEDGGAIVHQTEAAGGALPATYGWDGLAGDQPALAPGKRYSYQLTIDVGGARGISPLRHFTVDDPDSRLPRAAIEGRLFAGDSRLSARLRNHLARLVTRLARREDDGRTPVFVIEMPRPRASAAEIELELAARRAALRTYLSRLGLADDRYRVRADATDSARDRFDVLLAAPETAATPRVTIDGVAHEVRGSAFAAEVSVRAGQTVILDVTDGGGHRAIVPLTVPEAPAEPAPAPPAPIPSNTPAPAAAPVAAQRVVLELPPTGHALGARELGVRGETAAGNRVFVGRESPAELRVGEDGRFAGMVELPVGASELIVQVVDPAGNRATLTWPVEVAARHWFVMGLAEGTAGSAYTERGWLGDAARVAGASDRTSVQLGPVALHGRAVGYVHGWLPGGPLAESIEVTAHVDTAQRPGSGAFFDELIDPHTTPPVHGDSAAEVHDANSRGPFYLAVRAGDSQLRAGSIHAELEGGELLRYQRTTSGAMAVVRRELADGHDVAVDAFGASSSEGLARSVDLLRATGGSLYYLRHAEVVEGSERVRLITRDASTGAVLAETLLARNQHYAIDYAGGRVLMVEPVASSRASAWLLDELDGRASPLDGHPVYVEVGYEHRGGDGTETSGGALARYRGGPVTLGVGAVGEDRPGGSYSLYGGSARIGSRTSFVSVEAAVSEDFDADSALSVDGGLTFGDLDGIARTSASGRAGAQLGWRAAFGLRLADVFEETGEEDWRRRLHVDGYWQDLDRGFSSAGTILEQGRHKLGATVRFEASDTDTWMLRHRAEVAELPRVGPAPADVAANIDPLALDEVARWATQLQWGRKRDRWHHRVEVGASGASSSAPLASGEPQLDYTRYGAGAATAYAVSERLTVRAGQRVQTSVGGADPLLDPLDPAADPYQAMRRDRDVLAGVTSSIGADVALTPEVAVSADWLQRWNGDNAAQVGLKSALSPTGTMYVRERVGREDGELVSRTAIGAEDRIEGLAGGRSYGEYQLENGVAGVRNRAVLGLGRRWQAHPGLRLATGFEHQQVFGGFAPDGTALGDFRRDVVHAGAELTGSTRYKAAASVELRLDDGTGGAGDAIDTDPRTAASGAGIFADHGGVAPGAPMLLPRGERVQLVSGAGASARVQRDHTLLTRVRLSRTWATDGASEVIAGYTEVTGGWAYRPLDHDWADVLVRYSYLADQRPETEAGPARDRRAHVLAILPMARLPHDIDVAGKIALKRTLAADAPAGVDDLQTDIDTEVDAILWLVRLGYGFHGRWDASAELRQLILDIPGGFQTRLGTLVELGFSLDRHVRLGAGYDFGHFSDDELGDLQRDTHGVFVRVTGQL